MTMLFKNCLCKVCKYMYYKKYCIINFQEIYKVYVFKKEYCCDSNNGNGKYLVGDGGYYFILLVWYNGLQVQLGEVL